MGGVWDAWTWPQAADCARPCLLFAHRSGVSRARLSEILLARPPPGGGGTSDSGTRNWSGTIAMSCSRDLRISSCQQRQRVAAFRPRTASLAEIACSLLFSSPAIANSRRSSRGPTPRRPERSAAVGARSSRSTGPGRRLPRSGNWTGEPPRTSEHNTCRQCSRCSDSRSINGCSGCSTD